MGSAYGGFSLLISCISFLVFDLVIGSSGLRVFFTCSITVLGMMDLGTWTISCTDLSGKVDFSFNRTFDIILGWVSIGRGGKAGLSAICMIGLLPGDNLVVLVYNMAEA